MPVTPEKLAGWRIEPPVVGAGCAGTRRAADGGGRAARRASPAPRDSSHGFLPAEGGFRWTRSHRELVAVELAERDRDRRRQLWTDGRRRTGSCSLEHLRAGGGGQLAVTKMSLWASGTPSSGPVSPCARVATAAAAWQRSLALPASQDPQLFVTRTLAEHECFRGFRRWKRLSASARPSSATPSRFVQFLHSDDLRSPGTNRLHTSGALRWLSSRDRSR
jgi:hypothetical protein